MKFFYAFYLLIVSSVVSAQFNLEHTYDESVPIRINLHFSGEKYYIYNRLEKAVTFYNSDHTVWQIIEIPVPSEIFLANNISISDNLFNSDANIEIVYS